jgi:hypothetical protein
MCLCYVQVTGENVPQPVGAFESAGLCPFVLNNVKKSGYLKPTPVQKYALPIIMSGRDLMACAQTGSGKTVRVCEIRTMLIIILCTHRIPAFHNFSHSCSELADHPGSWVQSYSFAQTDFFQALKHHCQLLQHNKHTGLEVIVSCVLGSIMVLM